MMAELIQKLKTLFFLCCIKNKGLLLYFTKDLESLETSDKQPPGPTSLLNIKMALGKPCHPKVWAWESIGCEHHYDTVSSLYEH